jgi:hypothetical protein
MHIHLQTIVLISPCIQLSYYISLMHLIEHMVCTRHVWSLERRMMHQRQERWRSLRQTGRGGGRVGARETEKS